MKKTFITIVLIVIFFIIYFLQSNFFTWFNIAGVMPNVFIIFVLLLGLFAGETRGIIFGIIFGISIDFFIGSRIGISGIMLGIIGFLGGYLDKSFSKDSRVTIILMIVLSTCLYETGNYVFHYFMNHEMISMTIFIKTLLIENIYHIILTIIFYPLMLKLGYKLEKTFKESQILTRYF